MIEFRGENPYVQITVSDRLLLAATEVPITVARLRNTFEQKTTDVAYAQTWLNEASKIGRENNLNDVFPNDSATAVIDRKLASGFSMSVFSFTTDTGIWVLKIGAQKAAAPGWLDPSSKAYAEWYSRNLHILYETLDNCLPHAIPKPQYVMHATTQKQETSLVIQPYIPLQRDLTDAVRFPHDIRKSILDEFEVFYRSFEELRKKHGLFPDLGRKGNLVLSDEHDIPHLVLVDNELIDQHTPSPLINLYNALAYHTRLQSMLKKLEKSFT
ncbi:MAG: hypothetical protein Q7S38_00445 [bacterium]|nr:hypothetical protein [bacterium]